MNLSIVIENTLYFLALINPASKILFLSSKVPAYTKQEIVSISIRSSIVAFCILAILATFGNFLLQTVFHVEIYSLSVAGGIILFIIGLTAVRQGKFFEDYEEVQSITDLSIVPLAAPLIAGPGTMTAAISFSSMHGIVNTLLCVFVAICINLFLMLMSQQIGRFFERVNATGPVIRITGLVVTAVATQMIFNGCGSWFAKILMH